MRMLASLLWCCVLMCCAMSWAHAADPVIDVHRHASWPGGEDDAYRERMLAEMDANGVVLALLSFTEYPDVASWVDAAPGRFLAGPNLPCPRDLAEPRYRCFPEDEGWVDIDWLEQQVGLGTVAILHELAPSYSGLSVANPRLAPYWALAARHDLPVGVHTQRGPAPGAAHSLRANAGCCPDYDPAMGNPASLRPVLDRHPGLRVWIQHVGAGRGEYAPFREETLALLRDYPNVFLDLSITNGGMAFEQYEATLRDLVDAGFGDRIMFGSDNLPLAPILSRLDRIEWLTAPQRRAILYDNAARFLRLDAATIARHHGR